MSDNTDPILINPPKKKRPKVTSVRVSKKIGYPPVEVDTALTDPYYSIFFKYSPLDLPLEQEVLDLISCIQISIAPLILPEADVAYDDNNLGMPILIPSGNVFPFKKHESREFFCNFKHPEFDKLNSMLMLLEGQNINISIIYHDDEKKPIFMDTFSTGPWIEQDVVV